MTPATILEHDGTKQPVTEWALDYGLTPGIIIARLERGMSIADAITMPMKVGHLKQRLPVFSPKQVAPKRVAPKQVAPKRRAIVVRRAKNAVTYAYDGKTLSISEWAKLTGLKESSIRARLVAGWSIERALTSPLYRTVSRPKAKGAGHGPGKVYTHDGKTLSAAEWSSIAGVSAATIDSRLRRGWPLAYALSSGPRKGHRPGVSSNFAPLEGTGGGSTSQETTNLSF